MTATIYYSDQVYEGGPEDAPTRDVQAIVQPADGVGWAMQHTADPRNMGAMTIPI